ncbi:hypothetical protein AB0B28_06730 [Glycomyces sp. NPDC046736]|uniref:hypothetical protein n=1 Tax=Glycomyces sp. NPDC046736 TaxID=3155615 RepID=UPI0033E6D421
MENPAYELLQLLEKWQPKDSTKSIAAARGGGSSAEDITFWAEHRKAVSYLLAIERQLDEMEAAKDDVDAYRQYVPMWYRAVFGPKYNWYNVDPAQNSNKRLPGPDGGRELATDAAALLRSLGSHIQTWRVAETIPSGVLPDLLSAVDEAEDLVRLADIPDQERQYVLRLIRQVREVLADVELFGQAENRRLVIELGGAMTIVYGCVPDREKTKAGSVIGRILRGGIARVTGKALDTAVVSGVQELGPAIGDAIGL